MWDNELSRTGAGSDRPLATQRVASPALFSRDRYLSDASGPLPSPSALLPQCASRSSASSAPAPWVAASPPSPPRPASRSSCSTSPARRATGTARAKAGLERARKARPAAFMDPARAAPHRHRQHRRRPRAAARLRSRARGDHRAARAQAGALRAARAAAQADAPSSPATRRASRCSVLTEGRSDAVPPALPRHALLQSAALPAPARAHPDAGDRARGARRRRGTSAKWCSARGSSIAKDVPGFVANRLGVYGMVRGDEGDDGVGPHDRRGGHAHRPAARPREERHLPHRRHHRARRPAARLEGAQREHGRGLLHAGVGGEARRERPPRRQDGRAASTRRSARTSRTLDWQTLRVRAAAEGGRSRARAP